MIELSNKTAVVTGASGGIGHAIALRLAQKKMKLCLVGRNANKLAKQKSLMLEHTTDVLTCTADFTKTDDLKKISTHTLEKLGSIDVLVHSAGFLSMASIEKSAIDSIDLHYKINFLAPFLITQGFLTALKKTQGQIVFLNTSATQRPIPRLAQYASSKLALKGFTDTLREEVNDYGVRVTNIYPGQTATAMQKDIYDSRGDTYKPERMLQPQDIADIIIHTLMMPRTAEITDIHIRPMQKG
jgi:short-subunit dehydrogenase